MTAQEIWEQAKVWVPLGISAAAAAMAVLPQGKTGTTWDKVRTIVNYLALNFGSAKNVRTKP